MDGPANVQCYVPCVRGYLDGKIDEPPSEGGRVRGGGYRLGRHVPLVGLEEEVRDGQHEIIGPVHAHPFKGKALLGRQFLYAPVYQLVGAPLVRLFHDRPGIEVTFAPRGPQPLVRFWAIADIGVDDIVGLAEIHHELSRCVALQPGEDRAAEPVPALEPAPEFDISPDGPVLLQFVEVLLGDLPDVRFHVPVQFPRRNEMDAQSLEFPVGLLVGEPAVRAQYDGHLGGVTLAYQLDHRPYPVRIVGPVVRMGTALPEHDVYQERPPANVQGLEPFLALVGGLAALALRRTVVVEHHGIDAQLDDLRPFDLQPPYEQFVEYFVEGGVAEERKFGEVALDLVGRGQFGRSAFQYRRMAPVRFPLVEPRHGHVRPVDEEREHLLYEFLQPQPLAALRYEGRQLARHHGVQACPLHVPQEKCEAAACRDLVVGYAYFCYLS